MSARQSSSGGTVFFSGRSGRPMRKRYIGRGPRTWPCPIRCEAAPRELRFCSPHIRTAFVPGLSQTIKQAKNPQKTGRTRAMLDIFPGM